MAEFEKLIVTEKGKALVMKTVNSEHRILFSRIAVSNVGYAQEELISLETIEGIRQMTVLSEIETDGPDSIRIHAILSNAQLEEGYYLRTVGLYAEDPDEGEILYGVSVEMSEDGCYVPPFRGRTASNLYFNLSVAVGNSENVILKVDQGAVATVKQLNKVRYPEFEMAGERENLVSGERQDTLFGKIARWFADLKAIAFSGSYRDLSDKPALGSAAAKDVVNNDTTSSEGYVADARVVKVHGDEIDSLNTALAGHKTSGDHDGRYYTEAEVNSLINTRIPATASCNRNWNWSGQAGQPTWLWGGNDAANMYVYNPTNFNVSYAETAHGLRTYNASGGSHGAEWILRCKHNMHGDGTFGLYVGDGSLKMRIDYANMANIAARIGKSGDANHPMTFHWAGQGGQPAWLWGGNDSDPSNMYVWNPANFHVNIADIAKRVNFDTGAYIWSDNRQRLFIGSSEDAGRASFHGLVNNVWTLCPSINNNLCLGVPNFRWEKIYSSSSTISTSDRNLKKDIKPLSEQHLKFFMRLQPVSFLFRDGESGRTHTGFIAQDVEEAMAECGLTDLDFAGFCKDVKQKESRIKKIREVKDEDGKTREEEYEETVYEDVMDENGNPEYIYSLRYEEFIALNTHMIQTVVNRMEEMDQRMADLEKRIARSDQPEQV